MAHVCRDCGQSSPSPGSCPRDGSRLVEASDPFLGTSVGPWRIAHRLGAGGHGTVYRAVHPTVGGRVAVKVLSKEAVQDPDLVDRFFAEAQTVNLIRHDHIVKVIDLGFLEGRPYIVMEHVDGAPLSAILKRLGPLPLGSLGRLMGEVLSALGAAHARGIVHRDVKPDNILVTPSGHAKVVDFGLAKLSPELDVRSRQTRAGLLLGTPQYLSPEQADARPVEPRSDLYSVGVVLFEAAIGRLPFEGRSLYELLRLHLEAPPPSPRTLRPDLPEELERLILRALAKRPEARPASAEEMGAALARSIEALPPDAFAGIGLASAALLAVAPPDDDGAEPTRATRELGAAAPGASGHTTHEVATRAEGSRPSRDRRRAGGGLVRRRRLLAVLGAAALAGFAIVALARFAGQRPGPAATAPGAAAAAPAHDGGGLDDRPAEAGAASGAALAVAQERAIAAASPPVTPAQALATPRSREPTAPGRVPAGAGRTPDGAVVAAPAVAAPGVAASGVAAPGVAAPGVAGPATPSAPSGPDALAAPASTPVAVAPGSEVIPYAEPPSRIDPLAFLDRAERLARARHPGARLVVFATTLPRNGLHADVTAGVHYYAFTGAAPGRYVQISVTPRGLDVREVESANFDRYPPTRKPRCGLAEIWRRIDAAGADVGRRASVSYSGGVWYVPALGPVADDCGAPTAPVGTGPLGLDVPAFVGEATVRASERLGGAPRLAELRIARVEATGTVVVSAGVRARFRSTTPAGPSCTWVSRGGGGLVAGPVEECRDGTGDPPRCQASDVLRLALAAGAPPDVVASMQYRGSSWHVTVGGWRGTIRDDRCGAAAAPTAAPR